MNNQKKHESVRLRGENWYYRIKVLNKYGEWKWTERNGGKTKVRDKSLLFSCWLSLLPC